MATTDRSWPVSASSSKGRFRPPLPPLRCGCFRVIRGFTARFQWYGRDCNYSCPKSADCQKRDRPIGIRGVVRAPRKRDDDQSRQSRIRQACPLH